MSRDPYPGPNPNLMRLTKCALFACLAVSAFYASASVASVCRVTPTGIAAGSGAWGDPMDMQTALGSPVCDEIWAKAGTYKPTTGTDRNISFTLDRKVAVYGGFAGSENTRDQRNPATHVSILSGDIGTASDASDNSYHVVYIVGNAATTNIGNDTVLDGFTITDGNADGLSFPLFNGGGLFCTGEQAGGQCSPTLRQLVFTNNHASSAGGAMEIYCWVDASATPILSDIQFSNNSAGSKGGAVHHGNECDEVLTLERVTFDGNSAFNGGALLTGYGSGVELYDAVFTNNTATEDGGATHITSLDNVTLERVRFEGNNAGDHAGAMYNRSTTGRTSTISLSDVTFNNNSALNDAKNGQGGAMNNEAFGGNINLLMNRVTLSNNQADFAGAIRNIDSYVGGNLGATLANVTFSNNSATTSSRDMTNAANYHLVDIALRNVTLDSSSSGFYSLVNSSTGDGTVILELSNVILWDSTPSLPIINSGTASTTLIDHSIVVRSNGSGGSWTSSLGADGGGNMDADPLLGALADNGGLTKTMIPAAGSPAIDAGDATTCAAAPVSDRDQQGGARPHGPQCDIGSVEVGAIIDSSMIFADGFE